MVVPLIEWQKFEKTLPKSMTLFVIEATRGGELATHTKNDISIDDFAVWDKACGGEFTQNFTKISEITYLFFPFFCFNGI